MKNIGFKRAVKTAFFPARCPYCDIVIDPERYACADCGADLPEIPVISYIEGGFRCVSPFLYTDCYAEAVKRFKFSGRAQYSEQLAFAVVTALNCSGDLGFDYVTCVPMHRDQKIERGYNQSELLAKDCAALLGMPYLDLLEKFKRNKIQHELKGKERRANVKGVYRTVNTDKLKGRRVLLIDDIITTGNTMRECAVTLKKGGCAEIKCAAICYVN